MQFKLTPFERIQLLIALPRNCPLAEMGQVLRIADALDLSSNEKTRFGYEVRRIETPQGPITFTDYNESAEGLHSYEADIELDGVADFEKLHQFAKDRTNWPRCHESLALMDKLDAWKNETRDAKKSDKT